MPLVAAAADSRSSGSGPPIVTHATLVPFLSTEGPEISARSRRPVPVMEPFRLYVGAA